MTFRPSAPNKKRRWAALLAIVVLSTGMVGVGTALATPTFAFVGDQSGANDEPGQKDLTAQAAAFDGSTFYSAWKWDDTSWSGKNTGDGCSLFDSDGDGLVNFAVCVTVGTKNATELSTRVYSCGDTRSDRCTNPILLIGTEGVTSTNDWCSVASATGQFDATDTQATCNISQLAADIGSAATGIVGANLINTCSYPSQEPNSDPSDCVIIIANVDVTVSTTSAGTITWTATLSDTASLNPSSATGSVTFKLYSDNTCTDANLIWTSDADSTAPFSSGTTGGSPVGGNVVTGTDNPTTNLHYYWIATYTPSGAFNGNSSACGEANTINVSVTGS
jgi:hypothetical protein